MYAGGMYLLWSGLVFAALILPELQSAFASPLEVGQVALQEYRSPQTLTYISEVLTEQRREAASMAVAPVYTPPDTQIARQRLEDLRNALAFITSVRADGYATTAQKLTDLAALQDIRLNHETASAILGLTDTRWQAIQQEALIVLEKVMSSVIRPEDLEDTRLRVPTLVSLSLPENQAAIVAELVSAFIAPNSFYSESLTEAARERARAAVEPVSRTYVLGQTVVSRGQVLSAADIEALQKLGLVQVQPTWMEMLGAALLALLLGALLLFFLERHRTTFLFEARSFALILLMFFVFALGGRLLIPSHTVIPYAFPIAAFGLLTSTLFGMELALALGLPLAVVVAYHLPIEHDLTVYYLLTSIFGVFALGRAQRFASFFSAGLAIAFVGSLVVLVYRLPLPTTDAIGLLTLFGAAFFNGLASASLAMLVQNFLAQLLRMTTPMQLMDLARPDRPLLKQLLRDAPGTYQHSLQLANLGEAAAEQIGADALLTRVGALYHDIGKILNPYYFIENQPLGLSNPHDDLDPESSAAIIIRHVPDGVELARQHHLPSRIVQFIREHHGTMLARYQYSLAVEAAGGDESKVDREKFRYPGPRPQSKETAIIMLADGCEARMRAERPADEQALRKLVKEVTQHRLARGQLEDTNLTLRELSQIEESFIANLRGVYHPRVAYPRLKSEPYVEPVTHPATQSSEVKTPLDLL